MKRILSALIIAVSLPTYSMVPHDYLNGMRDVYKQLELKHKDDKAYLKKLHEAQTKWKEFVDAQSELMYLNHGGTLAPMCMNAYTFSLDVAIANETKYLFYYEDGDSCSGA